jgi:outer membrane cobalamin receptor
MKYGFMAVCVVVSGMVFVSGARAEEADVKLPEVVVTATKTEKDPKDVTQSVTVITADDIKKSGATTAGEAIQNTVGMRIRDNGPEGAEASVSIRGATSAQVLVLLDGRRLNSPRTGGYNLSDLPVPLDSIERIEIVRGPSSALYGADAAGGVVNIITKKPKESKTTAEASAGSHGYDLLAIRNQGSVRLFSYSLSADRETSDGYRANSNLDQARTGGSIGYDFSADSRLDVRVDYLSKEQGVRLILRRVPGSGHGRP